MLNGPKPVAVVAAMPIELAPLLERIKSQQIDGVDLFELDGAVVAIGGIGEKFARRAAETAVDYGQPRMLVSAGIAGAISQKLRVGDVGRIREVVDVATGERYPTSGGEWVLATSQDVSAAGEKNELLTKYGADVVDMEGAAVAQVAKERGLEFAAVKAISDDAAFPLPPLMRFINNGKFDNRRFLLYIALRPKWWPVLKRIRSNTGIATTKLCEAVEHLIGG